MTNDRFRSRNLAILAGVLLLGGALPLAAMAGTPQPTPGKDAAKKTRIVLVTDDGKGEQKVEIDDLGELADGETREVANAADGTKVTVRRDGDELVVKTAGGKEIRVPGAGDKGHAMAFVSDDGGDVKVMKRVVMKDGEGGGEPMIWMQRGGGPGCGCPCGHGGGHAGMGHHAAPRPDLHGEREIIREGGPGEDREVFVMHGGPGLHGPMIDHVIEQLEASKSFQELDQATRDKVVQALREQSAAGPAHRRVEVRVIEEKDGKKEKPETKE
jgi:hypothetical protein